MGKVIRSALKFGVSALFLQETFARERRAARFELFVSQIRGNMNRLKIADMSKILCVSPDNCASVIATINAHPDWDDERVAEEIVWEG